MKHRSFVPNGERYVFIQNKDWPSQIELKKRLEKKFNDPTLRSNTNSIFIHVGFKASDGVRYGSYRHITREELSRHSYVIEPFGWVSILITDIIYKPRMYNPKL